MSFIDPTAYPVVIGDGGSTAATEGLPALLTGGAPDSLIDWGAVGDLHVRAATTRGRMHRFDQTPRQDAFGLAVAEGRALVLAVADGVSAAPRSQIASEAAVAFATTFVVDQLAGEAAEIDWTACVAGARARVLAEARADAGDPDLSSSDAADRMATTLTVAVIDLDPGDDGSRAVRVMSFGDVGAWLLGADGAWRSVTPVKNAEAAIAGSAVAALPIDYGGSVEERVDHLVAGDAFFLLSDGIGDPLADGTGIVGSELAKAWGAVPSPYAFAAWTDFARRTHTDDRTAVGVWPTWA